jgi:hypothetical protein
MRISQIWVFSRYLEHFALGPMSRYVSSRGTLCIAASSQRLEGRGAAPYGAELKFVNV